MLPANPSGSACRYRPCADCRFPFCELVFIVCVCPAVLCLFRPCFDGYILSNCQGQKKTHPCLEVFCFCSVIIVRFYRHCIFIAHDKKRTSRRAPPSRPTPAPHPVQARKKSPERRYFPLSGPLSLKPQTSHNCKKRCSFHPCHVVSCPKFIAVDVDFLLFFLHVQKEHAGSAGPAGLLTPPGR